MTEIDRGRLFAAYDRRSDELDGDPNAKRAWFGVYAQAYLPHLPIDGRILEIGCSRGYLLAALAAGGCSDLTGIDLSAGDVEHARVNAPGARVEVADAAEYVEAQAWDAIILKAVLEHVPKADVVPLVERLARGLKPGGVLLVDVPNMDWLFAGHERYMDFTHEVGFTQESLRQVLGLSFGSVSVTPIDNARIGERRLRRFLRPASRKILGLALRLADVDGASGPIWYRSLLAVARDPV